MSRLAALQLTKADKLIDPFIAAGDRAYLIGSQDGRFPPLGWHVEGQMGGVWAHPIKLVEGFWLQIDGHWLLDARRFVSGPFWNANEYALPGGLRVTRRQFVPDGEPAVVVRYTFRSSSPRVLRVRFLARVNLRPVWLAEKEGIADGPDRATYLADLGAWLCRDETNPWFVVLGVCNGEPLAQDSGPDLQAPEEARGRGISVGLNYELPIPGGRDVDLLLIIAGSDQRADAAIETYGRVGRDERDLWHAKAERYDLMRRCSSIDLPDAPIAAAWDWVKCNNDWLVRAAPGGGRGLGAGVAEFPWWFGCDNSYALLACLALGQHEVALDTLDLLRRLSAAANHDSGRVVHECTTRGSPADRGNTQETPQFVTTVWHAFRWTGDSAFLERNYDFCKRGLLEWTLGEQCPDGELLPYGPGIVEIAGMDLQCIDVATYTATALRALAQMAEVVGEEEVRLRCLELHQAARDRLEEAFWMEDEGLYGDFRATPTEMAARVRSWLIEAERLVARGEMPPESEAEIRRLLQEAESDPHPDRKRPWLCMNWTLVCPLEAALTRPERAVRALRRVEGPELTGRWGMYVSGLERVTSMSINTGALAVAELAYGRVDQALSLMRTITASLGMHMPGAISEISPDRGCFVQAWSAYGVVWPLVTQVFGLQPDAFRRHLEVRPRFPADWPRAALKDVRIGDASFDCAWDGHALTVACSNPSWTVSYKE